MISFHVGNKQKTKVKSKNLYQVYDNCDKCPLRAYIEATCNNNLKALIISGNPSLDYLKQTSINLSLEFSELSGNQGVSVLTSIVRKTYKYQANILSLKAAIILIENDRYNDVLPVLKNNKIKTLSLNETYDKLIKRIISKIKGNQVQLNELNKRYNKLSNSQEKATDIKAEYYTQLLVKLSKYIGFQLKIDTLTLAELAFYIKDYQTYLTTLNTQQHGSK